MIVFSKTNMLLMKNKLEPCLVCCSIATYKNEIKKILGITFNIVIIIKIIIQYEKSNHHTKPIKVSKTAMSVGFD